MADTRQYVDQQFMDELSQAFIKKKRDSADGFRRAFGAAATGYGAGAATGAALFKKEEPMPIQLLTGAEQLDLLEMLLDEGKDKTIEEAKTKGELIKALTKSLEVQADLYKAKLAANSDVDVAKINGYVDVFKQTTSTLAKGLDKDNAPVAIPETANTVIANLSLTDAVSVQALLTEMQKYPPESRIHQDILKSVIAQHPTVQRDGETIELKKVDDLIEFWGSGITGIGPDGNPTSARDPEVVDKITRLLRESQINQPDMDYNDPAVVKEARADLERSLAGIGEIDPGAAESMRRTSEALTRLAADPNGAATQEDKDKVKAADDKAVALATGATREEIDDMDLTPEELKMKLFGMIREDNIKLPDTWQRRFDNILQSQPMQDFAAKHNIPPERLEGMMYEAAKSAVKYDKLEDRAGKLSFKQSLRDTQGKEVAADRLGARADKIEEKAKPIADQFRFAKEPTPAVRTRPPTEERRRQAILSDFAAMGTSPNPNTPAGVPEGRVINLDRLMDNTSQIEDPAETDRKRKLSLSQRGVKSYDQKKVP